jgi:hypothetical protein
VIDWRHPRTYERLRCLGLCLFTLGIATHNTDNPPAALAAIVVTTLLVIRLKIEFGIDRNEEEHRLEQKLRLISRIDNMVGPPVLVGILAMIRHANSEDLSPFPMN